MAAEKNSGQTNKDIPQTNGKAQLASRKKGLTARQKEELDKITAELPQYENLLKGLKAAAAAAGSDYETIEGMLQEVQETQKKVDELTERWCELSDLAEE